MDNIPDGLFDLLSEKDYTELSSKEKAWVRQFMTSQAYSDLYDTVSSFKKADSEIAVSPRSFQSLQKEPSRLYRMLHYKIPMYKVAASFLLLFGLLYVLNNRNSSASTEDLFKANKTGVAVNQDNYPNDLIFEL